MFVYITAFIVPPHSDASLATIWLGPCLEDGFLGKSIKFLEDVHPSTYRMFVERINSLLYV